MDPQVFTAVMTAIRGWFSSLRDEQRALATEERRAVKALYVAANETRLYLNRMNRRFHISGSAHKKENQRNIEKEEELSRLWMDAHLELMPVNRDIADRCLIKSGYWSDPDYWNERDVQKANISLDSMFADAKGLL